MPITDLLVNGVELMLLGMGIVFVFLVMLIFALMLMSRISAYFDDDENNQQLASPTVLKIPDNTALLAVITAAVARYKSARP